MSEKLELPITSSQESMIMHSLNKPSYLVQYRFTLLEKINLVKFKHAWLACITRYPALCVSFHYDIDNHWISQVSAIHDVDWQTIKIDNNHSATLINKIAEDDILTNFDLETPLLMRFKLFQLAPERIELIWTFHHALLGASVVEFVCEVFATYDGIFIPSKIDIYKKTLESHQQAKKSYQNIACKHYWQEVFQQFDYIHPKTTHISITKPRQQSFKLDENISAQLQQLTFSLQLPLSWLLQIIFALTLADILSHDDICYGVVNNFPNSITNKIIGCFLNTLPIRLNLAKFDTLKECIETIKYQNQQLKHYFDTPLSEIQSWLGIKERLPCADFIFDFKSQFVPDKIEASINQLSQHSRRLQYRVDNDTTMLLEFFFRKNILCGQINYNDNLLNYTTVENFIDIFIANANKLLSTDKLITTRLNKQLNKSIINNKQTLTIKKTTQEKKITTWQKNILSIWQKVLNKTITINDNFFDHGGHSLLAMRIAIVINKNYHLHLRAVDILLNPSVKLLCDKFTKDDHTIDEEINKDKIVDKAFPLSFSQQRMMFLHEKNLTKGLYNIPVLYEINNNELNDDNLKTIFYSLLTRHEQLRTIISLHQNHFMQTPLPIDRINHFFLTKSANTESEFNNLIIQNIQQRFDLYNEIPIRVITITKNDKKYLLITYHHICCDDWSINIIESEISLIFHAEAKNHLCSFNKILPYRDFIKIENRKYANNEFNSQLDYWETTLSSTEKFQFDKLWIDNDTCSNENAILFDMSKKDDTFVDQLTHELKMSAFTIYLTLFAISLARISLQPKFNIGIPTSKRQLSNFENTVGLFLNTLIINFESNHNDLIIDILNKIKTTCNQALQHQEVPFELVVRKLLKSFSQGEDNPLFNIFFSYLPQKNKQFEQTLLKRKFITVGLSKFTLAMYMFYQNDQLKVALIYDNALLTHAGVNLVKNNFLNLLSEFKSNKHAPCFKQEMTHTKNKNAAFDSLHLKNINITENIFSIADKFPDKIAIKYHQEFISYRALKVNILKMAYILRHEFEIQINDRVIIYEDNSLNTVMVILTLIYLRSSFIPVNSLTPRHHLDFIIKQTQARLLLHTTSIDDYNIRSCSQQELINKLQTAKQQLLINNEPINYNAYIIYTSGTSGYPKGVVVSHLALLNNLLALKEELNITNTDKFINIARFSFDISLVEYLLPLLSGGNTVITAMNESKDPFKLAQLIQDHKINILQGTPSLFNMLINNAWLPTKNLTLISGGEVLSTKLAKILFLNSKRLYNVYGPTEATIWALIHQVTRDDISQSFIPLGHALNGMTYIIDEHKELFLSGKGLATSYVNNPSQTEYAFFIHPKYNTRYYKTGDIIRCHENKQLEYVGRNDHQFKINGYRVEAEEIESNINKMTLVSNSIICKQSENTKTDYIVALIETNNKDDMFEKNTIKHWDQVWDNTYANANTDNLFDEYIGWVNSSNGEKIPKVEMDAWLDATCSRILALNPQHVLEIGCGNGLILSRVAPHCQRYDGIDISSECICKLKQYIQHKPWKSKVSLDVKAAHEFDKTKKYDLVIINSVVQYFPSDNYLSSLLNKLSLHLTTHGLVFIGDIRAYEYISMFANEFNKKASKLTELLIAQSYFINYVRNSRIFHSLNIQLKHDSYNNEINKYRYDVILSKEKSPEISFAEISSTIHLDKILASNLNAIKINSLQNAFFSKSKTALLPSEIFLLAKKYHYLPNIFISSEDETKFTCLLNKLNLTLNINCFPNINKNTQHANILSLNTCQLFENNNRKITIQQTLRSMLPYYMIPQEIYFTEALIYTHHKKLDRKQSINMIKTYIKEKNSYQQENIDDDSSKTILLDIWSTLLNIDKLLIKPKSNFFELGGHSLLIVMLLKKIEDRLRVKIPLSGLYNRANFVTMLELINAKMTANNTNIEG